MKFELNVDTFRSFLKKIPSDLMVNVETALKKTAEDIIDLSQTRVPLENSDLQNSAFINDTERTGGRVSIEMGYVNEYALLQHEETEYNHPGLRSTNPSGGAQGQPFYLKSSVDEHEDNFSKNLKNALNAAINEQKMSAPPSEYPKKEGLG